MLGCANTCSIPCICESLSTYNIQRDAFAFKSGFRELCLHGEKGPAKSAVE